MRLDEQLNLVIPVDRADGTTIWVHASPISREVFEQHWLVMSKAFAALYGEGLGMIAGPRIAALMLRRVAEDAGKLRDADLLITEIRRLANVLVPAVAPQTGWQMYPLEVAVAQNMIDEDDAAEVEGVLCFFTLAWRLHRRTERLSILDGAARLWGALTSRLNLLEFANSLRTLNVTAPTGETPNPVPTTSSPPSSIGPLELVGGGSSQSAAAPTFPTPPRMNIANAS